LALPFLNFSAAYSPTVSPLFQTRFTILETAFPLRWHGIFNDLQRKAATQNIHMVIDDFRFWEQLSILLF
jgi:hypothetical protein